jgi:hypothetical protein
LPWFKNHTVFQKLAVLLLSGEESDQLGLLEKANLISGLGIF